MVTMLLVVLDDWTERVHVVCLWRWGRASVVQWVFFVGKSASVIFEENLAVFFPKTKK